MTNTRGADGRISGKTVRVTVNTWDGQGEPTQLEQRLSLQARQEIPMPAAITILDELLRKAVRPTADQQPQTGFSSGAPADCEFVTQTL